MSIPARARPQLTPRELEILAQLPLYKSAQTIADETFVSVNTIRTHVKSIYSKLGVSSRTAAVDCANELGLLPGDRPLEL